MARRTKARRTRIVRRAAAGLPRMPKPLRERVARERPDEVSVIETPDRRDPVVVVTKDGGRKVVGAWIDL
jgi:hypothetical protein